MSCGQRGSKVRRVGAVLAIAPSSATDVCETTSITSDPDNAWVARRQSAITAGLERWNLIVGQRESDSTGQRTTPPASDEKRQVHRGEGQGCSEQRLSGESDRIGKGTWDDKLSFGKRFGYL